MTEAPSQPKPKAYSYLRFSTPEQAQGDSKRRQWELAKAYAGENKLELDEELTFQDLGVSAFRGANAETGRLGDFLKAVDDGLVAQGSFLLVESLDRLSRSAARKALRVLEDIIDRGVTVVTLSDRKTYDRDSLDNDPMSLIMSILIFMRANEESATKSKRLKAAYGQKRTLARERREERPFTRRLPAWIRWSEDSKSFELIPERAEVVREIFELAEAGFGKEAIARTLNDRKVSTFGEAEFWRKSYVDKILNNPACWGTFVPRVKEFMDGKAVRKSEEPIKGYFPAVVERETIAPKTPRGQYSASPVSSIFQRLATCSLCGSSFVRVCKGKYTYLVCSKAHAKGGCEYRSVPYGEAEQAIRRNIKAIVAKAPRGENTEGIEREIAGLEEKLWDCQSRLEVLTDDYARTRSPAIRGRMETLERECEELAESLKGLRERREEQASGVILKRIEKLQAAFGVEPFDRGVANKALAGVVREMRFDPKLGLIDIQWQGGEWADEAIPIAASKFSKVTFGGEAD